MLKIKVFARVFTLFFLVLMVFPFSSYSEESRLEEMFLKRDWRGIDGLFQKSHEDLTPRDLSLVTNALWLQKRWDHALPLLMDNRESLPPELKPYQDMMIMLALERTGQGREAYDKALALLEGSPGELVYYVYYALARLSVDMGTSPSKWYHLMLEESIDRDHRTLALKGIVGSGEASTGHCLDLLHIEPLHKKALSILRENGETSEPEVNFALGYAEYLLGRYENAISYLGKVTDQEAEVFRKAEYYRAFSWYRLKSYEKALEIWMDLAQTGGTYSISSTRRIAYMSGNIREKVRSALETIALTDNEVSVTTARFHLLSFQEGPERIKAEDSFISSFPGHEHSTRILWVRGWEKWMAGDITLSLEWWDKALEHASSSWEPRLLFWKAMALEKASGKEKAVELFATLARKYPLSIYALRAFPNGAKPIRDEIPEYLFSERSLLEEWGFIPYARIRLSVSSQAADIFRAAQLARWIGDHLSAFRGGNALYNDIVGGEYLPRNGLELLYPRPYLSMVEQLGKEFKVDPYLLWSIMRQESAFDPNATSYVGASGLMQLMPATADDEARILGIGEYDVYDEKTNLLLGASHISRLLRSFVRIDWAVAAYNAGSGSVRRWLKTKEGLKFEEWMEEIPYDETAGYVSRVFANLKMYRLIYEKE